jgi:hypothetical protein
MGCPVLLSIARKNRLDGDCPRVASEVFRSLWVNEISFARLGKLRSYKFHELTQAYARIIINMALLNCILRAIMKVFGISRNTLPICVWKIIMAVHGAIDVPSLPMIRKSPRDL